VLHAKKTMKLDNSLKLTEEFDKGQIEEINVLYRSYMSVNQYTCSEDLISD
jgi:hypothetical protein